MKSPMLEAAYNEMEKRDKHTRNRACLNIALLALVLVFLPHTGRVYTAVAFLVGCTGGLNLGIAILAQLSLRTTKQERKIQEHLACSCSTIN